jgi:protein-S-isoprenylcysteine O-methyltransferase Ste14
MTTSPSPSDKKTTSKQGILRWAIQMLISLLTAWVVLFLSAGRLTWPAGWAFFALNALTQVLSSFVLTSRQPGMLAERSKAQAGTKGWDKFFAPAIVILGSLATFITAGLDARWGWSGPVNNWVWLASFVAAFASQMFVLWAMASNPFFATTVRIQEDRGHHVVNQGPYQFIRHPGYLGSVIYTLLTPLMLASHWTFIPAFLTVVLLVVRTGLEDHTLKAELPGYLSYSGNVRYRLFPGIW